MGKHAEHSAMGLPFARREQSGSIMVLTALMMVVMIGFVGLAIDVGHQMDVRRQTQNAADAAALGAAYALYTGGTLPSSVPAGATAAAQLAVQQNGFSASALQSLAIVTCPTPNVSAACVQAVVSTSLPNFFIPVLGLNRSSVGTKAVAEFMTTGPCQLCILNHSKKNAFNVSGGGSVSLSYIGVVDNSANSCGFDVTNNTTTTIIGSTIGLVANPPDPSCLDGLSTSTVPPVPDPLAWVPVPTGVPAGSCASSSKPNICSGSPIVSVDVHGSDSATLNPGVYNSVKVTSSASLTLNPGIYVFTGAFSDSSSGPLSVNSTGVPTGKTYGVMLYTTCPNTTGTVDTTTNSLYYSNCVAGNQLSGMGSLSLTGQGQVTLNAPTTDQNSLVTTDPAYVPKAYNGILFFQDRNDGNVMSLTGQSSASSGDSYSGTIYAKSSLLQLAGGSSASTGLDSDVVVDQLNITGSSGGGGLTMKATPGLNAQEATLSGLVT